MSVDFIELKGDLNCFDCRKDAVAFIESHYLQYLHDELIQWMDWNFPYGDDFDPTI